MGKNKALLVHEGQALWRCQYQRLIMSGAARRWVSLRADDDWLPAEIPRVYDPGNMGPLGGVIASFSASSATHLMVLAVDLPRLPEAWFHALRKSCTPGVGAIGWHRSHNRYEPLAAIYPREFLSDANDAVLRHDFSLQSPARRSVERRRLVPIAITEEQQAWFTNWNTPEDVTNG